VTRESPRPEERKGLGFLGGDRALATTSGPHHGQAIGIESSEVDGCLRSCDRRLRQSRNLDPFSCLVGLRRRIVFRADVAGEPANRASARSRPVHPNQRRLLSTHHTVMLEPDQQVEPGRGLEEARPVASSDQREGSRKRALPHCFAYALSRYPGPFKQTVSLPLVEPSLRTAWNRLKCSSQMLERATLESTNERRGPWMFRMRWWQNR
jgi:hypothetical protein